MPIPNTLVTLASALATGDALRLQVDPAIDLSSNVDGSPGLPWLSSIADLNGDGLAEVVVGVARDDDKALDAGRIVVRLGQAAGGTGTVLMDALSDIVIDGVAAGDLAGSSVSWTPDLNGDGRAELLVGAPGFDPAGSAGAGAAFVLWTPAPGGSIDLGDPATGGGKGYVIRGQAAGDAAGTVVLSIGDLNGDGRAETVVGAPGQDANGVDAGAVYVVWGKASTSAVNLAAVAGGSGGFRIVGEDNGDASGRVLAVVDDMNGDGLAEIAIGTPDHGNKGSNAGAVYVVFGKGSGTEVDLQDVAAGSGGFIVNGRTDDDLGAAVSRIGDIDGDGRGDLLIGAPRSNSAYVVFGKADGAAVQGSALAAGQGGWRIVGEQAGDLDSISVTGGADLNRDGIADLVIGAPGNEQGGSNAGAVYVVWGGAHGTADLSLVRQGIGGAKVVGQAGSLAGSAVAIIPDQDGDGSADLLIGAPGTGSVFVLHSPSSWQPDLNAYGTAGSDLIGPAGGASRPVGDGADSILALDGNDTVDGGGGDDRVEGMAGNDQLTGGDGNDTLDGGTGVDVMDGGVGDDTYVVDQALDTITDVSGVDTVMAQIAYTLGDGLENLVLQGAARQGTGNAAANTLDGTAFGDMLDGAGGADTLRGGAGNDRYLVDQAGDVAVELAGGGLDTVVSSIDWTLGSELERLELTGAARRGTGNGLANTLVGTALADTLDGAAGTDTMQGGLGDDTYRVDAAGDVVLEAAGGGDDLVIATTSYTLGAEVERLQLTGTARAGTGNALANTLSGTNGADTLDGAGGADLLIGGKGNDRYLVDNAADVVQEAAAGGTDTVVASVDHTLGAELERLELTGSAHRGTGNAKANAITGGTGADTLDGAAGNDTMTGGAGDDTYVVAQAGDVVVEAPGGGHDTVLSSISWTLGGELESLVLTRSGLVGTGNALDNTLTGSAGKQTLRGGDGADTLDGGAGADVMEGGAGDDTYVVDNLADLVTETADGGIDTVITSVGATIGAHIENLKLAGGQGTLIGNAADNRLSGHDLDDTLDGGDGDDLELGGDGDDVLISRSGSDTLSGGSGDDRYVVGGGSAHLEDFLGRDTLDASDALGDSYIDLSGETNHHIDGHDCDQGGGGTTSAPLDVQFLQDLSGSFADDIATVRTLVPQVVGALRAVQADSRFGVSTFIDKPVSPFGATGEWVYDQRLALTSDAAALTASYGAMVNLSGADAPEAQIESLMQLALRAGSVGYRADAARFVVLFTDAPFHQAGDGAAAGITNPNNGDAVLDGNGLGEDYPTILQLQQALVSANLIPIFAVAGGVEATYQGLVGTLGRGAVVTLSTDSSNVVAAITTGLQQTTTTRIECATGGQGDDTMLGSGDDNDLDGRSGDDHLDGRGGRDDLVGGDGRDTLDGGSGDDVMHGGRGDDHYLVDDAADLCDETGGDGVDTVETTLATYTLANGFEQLVYTGSAAFTGTGNGAANAITGSTGDDVLSGLGGADTLTGGAGGDALRGGAGDDVLVGGDGLDVLTGGTGADRFVFAAVSDSPAATPDRVQDFAAAEGDLIDLSAFDADPLTDGLQALAWRGDLAFSGSAAEVRWQAGTGGLTLQVDADGNGTADLALRLAGVGSLEAASVWFGA